MQWSDEGLTGYTLAAHRTLATHELVIRSITQLAVRISAWEWEHLLLW